MIKAIVFDAYGTLFDVYSVAALCNEFFPGQGEALSQTWRAKQLQYTWLLSLMGRYEDFWQVTEKGLVFACKERSLSCDEPKRTRLMEAYLHLNAYPEVGQALSALSKYRLAILSNGSPKMLQAVVKNNGLEGKFEQVISVDELKIYKPSPRVYELASKKLALDAREIGFVSSNSWDIQGAKSFGFRTHWVNRTAATSDELGFPPDATVTRLTDLPGKLGDGK